MCSRFDNWNVHRIFNTQSFDINIGHFIQQSFLLNHDCVPDVLLCARGQMSAALVLFRVQVKLNIFRLICFILLCFACVLSSSVRFRWLVITTHQIAQILNCHVLVSMGGIAHAISFCSFKSLNRHSFCERRMTHNHGSNSALYQAWENRCHS